MKTNYWSLENQVAIITGGGGGIGRSIALELAGAGANVALAGRRLPPLENVAEEVQKLGRKAMAVSTDTSKRDNVDNLVKRVMAEFGRVDILVNNAAVNEPGGKLIDLKEEDWDKVIDINLKGYLFCCQAVGKVMTSHNKGSIINIASVSAFNPFDGGGVYNISKIGVVMMTRVFARQLAGKHIRVNAIAPGYTRTEMTETLWADQERIKRINSWIPLGKMADPEDIARAAVYLASDASKHMTGQTMVVDGGQLLQYRWGV
jgi:3-oxoacyl-[acyl-carrier protein] reductase